MSNQCRHTVLKENWVWKLLRYGTAWLGSQGVFWKPDMRQDAAMEVREEVTRSKDLMEIFHGRIERRQGRRGMLTWRKKFKVQKEQGLGILHRSSPSSSCWTSVSSSVKWLHELDICKGVLQLCPDCSTCLQASPTAPMSCWGLRLSLSARRKSLPFLLAGSSVRSRETKCLNHYRVEPQMRQHI